MPRYLSLVVLLCGGLFACKPPSTPVTELPAEEAPRSSAEEPDAPSAQSSSSLIGTLSAGTFGPRLLLRGDSRLVVWLSPRGPETGLRSLVFTGEREVGPASKIAEAAEGVRFVELGGFGEDGALVLVVRRSGSQEVIELFELDAAGRRASGPHVVFESPREILWAQVVPTPRGAVILAAEASRDVADLFSVEFTRGASPGSPERVARSVSAWQTSTNASTSDERYRFHLATVEGPTSGRNVVWRKFDARARQQGAALPLARSIRGGQDLDLVTTEDRSIVVFSERGPFESRLRRVVIDAEGQVAREVGSLTEPRGDQALVRLVGDPQERASFVVWEEPARRPKEGRSLLISRLDEEGRAARVDATVFSTGRDPLLPSFVVHRGELVALTDAPSCPSDKTCEGSAPQRLLARVSPDFSDVRASVLELLGRERKRAALVWDASCSTRGCFALAADGQSSPVVSLLELDTQGGWRSPLTLSEQAPSPQVVAQEIVGELVELSALSGKKTERGALLSWVSYSDPNQREEKVTKPAPDGRMAPVRALLKTQDVTEDAEGHVRLASEQVISYRARSLGGVTMAELSSGRSLLAWSALDGASPHLFLTLVDAQGKKLRQKILKRPGGEVTDIAATVTSTGILLAWVDARDETPEIYAAIVNEDLEIIGREQRLTSDADQPTGVGVARLGDRVFVTWADARGSSRPGFSDLHGASLDESTAEILSPPRRLVATELHSHSPQLVPLGASPSTQSSALLGWIEADPGSERGQSALYLAEIDGEGRFIAPPLEVPLPGSARGFSAECELDECRIVSALDVGERGELWGLEWSGRGTPALSRLAVLDGPPSQTVAPLLLGRQVFYADQTSAGRFWLKRLTLAFSGDTGPR